MKYKVIGKKGQKIPVVGQGTGIGGNRVKTTRYTDKHVRALRLGIDLGMTLIDTAEEYGEGCAEEIIGRAIKDIRAKVFIATKFSPEHNSYNYVIKSAENSLRRLKTDYIDLYQIHWPNPKIPIEETMKAMERLLNDGKIRYIGVCNFSLNGLKEAQTVLTNKRIVSIQVEYNLLDRSIEKNILPYCEENNLIAVAYSPLEQGRIASGQDRLPVLRAIAEKYGATLAQVALSWLIAHRTVIVIPNATSEKHIFENARSVDFELSNEDISQISSVFQQECHYIPADRIRVFSSQGASQTIEDALANKMGNIPSPLDLSREIQNGEVIKPLRVILTTDTSGRYDYDLVEGKIRYWAWVIAHNKGEVPMPVYIRNDKTK